MKSFSDKQLGSIIKDYNINSSRIMSEEVRISNQMGDCDMISMEKIIFYKKVVLFRWKEVNSSKKDFQIPFRFKLPKDLAATFNIYTNIFKNYIKYSVCAICENNNIQLFAKAKELILTNHGLGGDSLQKS